jgi:hypothetical protein
MEIPQFRNFHFVAVFDPLTATAWAHFPAGKALNVEGLQPTKGGWQASIHLLDLALSPRC